MSLSSWRVSLLIARRQAWRSKGRSALIVALIGLPVFALAGADIVYRTWQLSPAQTITRQLGAADASLLWEGGQVEQTPKADSSRVDSPGQGTPPTTADVVAALPPGSRAIPYNPYPPTVRIRTASGVGLTNLAYFNYADPIARGLVHQVSGRAPRTATEVAVTTALARVSGLRIGDTMQSLDPATDFTVVGLVTDASHRSAQMAYTDEPLTTSSGDGSLWLVSTPSAVTWAQVQRLNGHGYLVVSRSVYLHPPAKYQVDFNTDSSSNATEVFATAALVAGMALLEIVLLAGPAFAVGARRQRRDLALIAAVGGRRSDLRRVVLATGVVLGIGAGVVCVLAGIGAAAIGVPYLRARVDQVPGPFDLHPLDLGALVFVSVLTALAAAVIPARAAGRLDIVATLAGRRGAARSRKRAPLIGASVAAVGVIVALGAFTASRSVVVILAGVALSEVGLIICTPALLGLTARLGPRLPVSGRIALRDASRNRSAASPAVAAVMAAVIGAVAIVLGVTSINDQDRRAYLPSLPMNAAYVPLDSPKGPPSGQVAAILRSKLPTNGVVTVYAAGNPCTAVAANTRCEEVEVEADLAPGVGPSRYFGGGFPNVVVDDGSALPTLLGVAAPAAVAALHAGKAVALDPVVVHNGQAALRISTTVISDNPDPAQDVAGPPERKLTVPAVVFTQGFAAAEIIIPPSMARQLGLASPPFAVLAGNSRAPTSREQQAVTEALTDLGSTAYLDVETGYHDPSIWLLYTFVAIAAVIAIGAALIATALTNADSRPDLTTLAAIGASPRTRRLLSLSRAAVIAGIGTVLGAVAGFLPAIAWVHAAHRLVSPGMIAYGGATAHPPQLHLVVPWMPMVATLVAIPVIAAMIAGASTRSRLPSERRAE